jgi:hypothetical protein
VLLYKCTSETKQRPMIDVTYLFRTLDDRYALQCNVVFVAVVVAAVLNGISFVLPCQYKGEARV